MRLRPVVLLSCSLVALVAACTGNGGGDPDGEERPTPVIAAIAPPLASVNSIVRIDGAGLAGARVRVLFGDVEGEVLTVTSAQIWARGVAGSGPSVDVRVEVNGIRSNALALALAPSGTLRPLAGGGLADPRGVTLDAGGGLLWVFDAESGVVVFSLANGAYRVHRPPDSALSRPVAGAALSETGILVVDSATNSIVVMDVDTTEVSPHVAGLAAPPLALALDTAGNLYWADGSGAIGRRSATGAIDAAFATVPAASGIAVAGGVLWASDPAAGALHQVDLGTLAVTSGFATGLAGVRGLSRDGTGVVACFDAGAARVDAAGAVTLAAPPHPLAGPASSACENGSGSIFTLGADGALESSKDGGAWLLRAPVLAADAADAVWTAGRFYVVSDARCDLGGTGSIVEVVAPGSFRSKASGVCARDTISARGGLGLAWVDRTDGFTRRLDLATGTVVVVASNAGFAGALGAAANFDSELFVSEADATLRRYGADGVPVAVVATGATHPVFAETLYFARGDTVVQAVFNHGDLVGFLELGGVPGLADLAPIASGGALAGDGALVRRFTPSGDVVLVGEMEPGDRLGFTPFGEVHRTRDGNAPAAVLP